ncbi:hypothetical protein CALCODRAFT_553307 [Calocera cornea HHB12733]|uniref:CxC1-like cysteine cluster associated with KDZ transposases domain-containing protein n=1 Tax=Calocera cornea HHB12733 TaxID=1353952 RepID=A0A165J027_9BASI|nr:hypothetical protein CALCODRAFT_553307 [Calocera cornea HHB12733]
MPRPRLHVESRNHYPRPSSAGLDVHPQPAQSKKRRRAKSPDREVPSWLPGSLYVPLRSPYANRRLPSSPVHFTSPRSAHDDPDSGSESGWQDLDDSSPPMYDPPHRASYQAQRDTAYQRWADLMPALLTQLEHRMGRASTPDDEAALPTLCETTCPDAREVRIRCVTFHGFTVKVSRYCQDHPIGPRLVTCGYWPSTPVRPAFAFDLDLLDFYLQLFADCASPSEAFCETLKQYHGAREVYHTNDKGHPVDDPFRRPWASAVQWYQVAKSSLHTVIEHRIYGERRRLIPCLPDSAEHGYLRKPVDVPVVPAESSEATIPSALQKGRAMGSRCAMLDGNFHHRRNTNGGKGPQFYEPELFLDDAWVASVGRRMEELRATRRTGPVRPHFTLPEEVVTACKESFKAAQEKDSHGMPGFHDEKGLVMYAVAIIQQLMAELPSSATLGVLYDVGCVLDHSCNLYGYLGSLRPRVVMAVSILHSYGHQWASCKNQEMKRILRASEIDSATIEDQIDKQRRAAVSVRSLAPKQILGKVQSFMKLQNDIEDLQSSIQQVRTSLERDLGPSKARALLSHMTESWNLLVSRGDELYAQLGIEEVYPRLSGVPPGAVQTLILARNLKARIRTRVAERMWERSRLNRAAGGVHQPIGQKLFQQIKTGITRRSSALNRAVKQFNAYVRSLHQGYNSAWGIALPQALNEAELEAPPEDHDIWQDVFLSQESPAEPWMMNPSVREAITAHLNLQRGEEEAKRLQLYVDNMLQWWGEELKKWIPLIRAADQLAHSTTSIFTAPLTPTDFEESDQSSDEGLEGWESVPLDDPYEVVIGGFEAPLIVSSASKGDAYDRSSLTNFMLMIMNMKTIHPTIMSNHNPVQAAPHSDMPMVALTALSSLGRSSITTINMLIEHMTRTAPISDVIRMVDQVQMLERQNIHLQESALWSTAEFEHRIEFVREMIDHEESMIAWTLEQADNLVEHHNPQLAGHRTSTFAIDQAVRRAAEKLNALESKLAYGRQTLPLADKLRIVTTSNQVLRDAMEPAQLEQALKLFQLNELLHLKVAEMAPDVSQSSNPIALLTAMPASVPTSLVQASITLPIMGMIMIMPVIMPTRWSSLVHGPLLGQCTLSGAPVLPRASGNAVTGPCEVLPMHHKMPPFGEQCLLSSALITPRERRLLPPRFFPITIFLSCIRCPSLPLLDFVPALYLLHSAHGHHCNLVSSCHPNAHSGFKVSDSRVSKLMIMSMIEPSLTSLITAPTTSTPSRSSTPAINTTRRLPPPSRHRSFTGTPAMDQTNVDPDASAAGFDDYSRIHTTQSDNGTVPPLQGGVQSRMLAPLTTPKSSALAQNGMDPQSSDTGEDMQVEGEFYAASAVAASDTSRLKITETVRPPRSVVSSVPPSMNVDPITRNVTRNAHNRSTSSTNPQPMDPPPKAEEVDFDDIDWDDPLHDDDLLMAQVEADARGVGERAEAYPWPVEHHVIEWSSYMHNTERVLEKFPTCPSIPPWVYKQSWQWGSDRKRALNQPRTIEGCHRDKFHMHGQAVHAWQMKGAVPRRNLFAKVYVPALLDHTEFGDRVIGAFVQATFIAKIDDGPARLPEVQVHFSRIIQNNEGMKRIGSQLAIAFKKGIADIAHENFTNYKRLEAINQERKALRKTPLENLTEPPSIRMRELLNHRNIQEAHDASLVPPDIAARVGVKAYRRLDDPDLYSVATEPPTMAANTEIHHDHELDPVHVPTPTAPVTRVFENEPPSEPPHDIGHGLQTAMLDYFNQKNLDPENITTALAKRVASIYWCCHPLSWRSHLQKTESVSLTKKDVDDLCFAMECQLITDWANGLR